MLIRNYLKVTWRSLLKNRLFTFLNVVGLSSGLAIALLLLIYVKDEKSFDLYHTKSDRIYRVGVTATFDGKSMNWANSPNATGPAMKAEIPEVLEQARLLYHDYGKTAFITSDQKKFTEKKLYWSDPGLFKIFDIPFLKGDPEKALERPNTVVISASLADKYFGKEDPLGKVLKVDNKTDLEITGIYADFPGNSTLDPNLIGSFSSVGWANKSLVWSNASFETYVLLEAGASEEKVEKSMMQLLESKVEAGDRWFTIWLQPLKDIHLGSAGMTNASTTRTGDSGQVKIMGILALVVLLIASMNYMNLATARSQLRFREVGINKTIGAGGLQLAGRFYLETAVLTLLSVLVAYGLVAAGIPMLNRIAQKNLSAGTLLAPDLFISTAAITLFLVLFAGSYPAFYLSSFRAKALLHTTFRKNTGAGLFRRTLVVLQFSASLILIVSALMFYKQLEFIREKNLGYQPDQVVAITTSAAENVNQIQALMDSYRNLSSVISVCRAQTWPGNGGSGRTLRNILNDAHEQDGMMIQTNRVTNEFAEVLGLKLLAGHQIRSERIDGDTIVQVVINRTAAAYLGYTPEEAIGKKAYSLFGHDRAEIAGVVEDFHFESFHQPIGAYAFHNNDSEWRPYLLVKLNTRDLTATMGQLERAFNIHIPNSAFDYTFIDQFLNTLYASEQRTAKVVFIFASLTILIACLGLFGLAAFTAEQRIKEIGVRKVLGASVTDITALLSGDFLKLVGIAILIASPLAWYGMRLWLQDFAYRVEMGWGVFVLAAVLSLLIAFFTVSFQSVKAAVSNPVRSLRSE